MTESPVTAAESLVAVVAKWETVDESSMSARRRAVAVAVWSVAVAALPVGASGGPAAAPSERSDVANTSLVAPPNLMSVVPLAVGVRPDPLEVSCLPVDAC